MRILETLLDQSFFTFKSFVIFLMRELYYPNYWFDSNGTCNKALPASEVGLSQHHSSLISNRVNAA
jgi:hypothetical protein